MSWQLRTGKEDEEEEDKEEEEEGGEEKKNGVKTVSVKSNNPHLEKGEQ